MAAFPILVSSLFTGIITSMWFERYSTEPFEIQSPLRQASSFGLVFFILATIAVTYLPKRAVQNLLSFFGLFGMVTAIGILLEPQREWWVPFFDNPSMGCCFVIMTLPLIPRDRFKLLPRIGFGLAVLCVYLIKASTPVLALAALIGSYIFTSSRRKYLWVLLGIPVICLSLLPYSFWMQDNGRFWIWKIATNWWAEQGIGTVLFGTGLSTTRVLLPIVQSFHTTNMEGPWFFWMHNDWLQILFEQGVVGLSAALLLFGYILKTSIKDRGLFSAIIVYSAVMVTNFPMHWPVQAFLGFVLVRATFYLKEKSA